MNPIFLARVAAPAILGIALLMIPVASTRGDEPSTSGFGKARLREPVALAFSDDASCLYVANRRSGSLSVLDTSGRPLAEYDVGRGLADVASLGDNRHLLVVDRAGNDLVLLARRGESIEVVRRLALSPDPVSLLVSPDRSMCVVASLWSRRLTFIDLGREAPGDDHPSLKIARTLDLPFSPRTMVQVRDGAKLVVTDAFGGRLAVVDARGRTLDGVRSIPAHNIRGMATAPDGETLVIAHQVLNRLARSSFDDVHWGLMVSNHLRLLRIEALLTHGSDGDLLKGSRLINLGNVGNAAGDPSDVVFDGAGGLIVALAGVDEVAMAPGLGRPLRITTVGRRPSAVAANPDASRVFVADSLDDTISVVREHGGQVETIPLGPRPELGPVERGERLFSDARISHDGWMSCHSCHTDGHTNGLLNDTLGDGTYGAAKRVPSLLGVGETGPWTWLGGMDRLEDQVRKSIGTTMRGATPSDEQVEALAAYLRSLAPPSPALADAARDDEAAVARGREVFRARECATCHAPPEYASKGRYDVGLVDEMGNRKFNPPSLRGVSRREPLLHDGRARTLEDVFLPHQHPRGMEFTPQEVSDLVAFLKSL